MEATAAPVRPARAGTGRVPADAGEQPDGGEQERRRNQRDVQHPLTRHLGPQGRYGGEEPRPRIGHAGRRKWRWCPGGSRTLGRWSAELIHRLRQDERRDPATSKAACATGRGERRATATPRPGDAVGRFDRSTGRRPPAAPRPLRAAAQQQDRRSTANRQSSMGAWRQAGAHRPVGGRQSNVSAISGQDAARGQRSTATATPHATQRGRRRGEPAHHPDERHREQRISRTRVKIRWKRSGAVAGSRVR